MKLLRIKAAGLPLFKGAVEFNFTAEQRITKENKEEMYNIFCNTYQNNVIAVAGLNASGKTSLLNVLGFSFGLFASMPIYMNFYKDILEGIDEALFETCFYSKYEIYCLKTIIKCREGHYYIDNEILMSKKAVKAMNKASVFEFSPKNIIMRRCKNDAYLFDDVSMIAALKNRLNESISSDSISDEKAESMLFFSRNIPPELPSLFDRTAEYLKLEYVGGKHEIRLKFKNRDEIVLYGFSELSRYLSAGTIKGMLMFLKADELIQNGGYMLADEIENHLSRDIIDKFLGLFQSKETNPKGAVLVFSTNYAELLDRFDRNDNIYITQNNSGITVKNLTEILKRNDIKKSEAFYGICSENKDEEKEGLDPPVLFFN